MFDHLDIEWCRLSSIVDAWRLVGSRRAPVNAPSEWDGWRVFNPDDERRRYATRAAEGVCTRCGEQPPRPGRKLCELCAAGQAERSRALRERRRRARLCIQCGAVSDGGLRCTACRPDYRTGGRWGHAR